ncbi:MAG: BatA and WFA domain-containing protein [Bacteroidales bacterium]|jgi:hypothetical protein|nr:BatA and WFA domain-containing protein [Bacteroidales bacterium]
MNFIYPYFLWGLLTITIPIVIHLFNFRRFKKVYFTNVAMLKQADIVTKKQNKIKNLLLLLVRCLTIIFLSLLFAQPYIDNKKNAIAKEGKNAVVVFVDNSFSMENAGQSGRVLDDAKAKARQIVEQFDDDDVYLLMTMDFEGKHKHFTNKQQFLSFLNDVDITPATSPVSEVLNLCEGLLSMRNEEKRLFVISDFQKSEFDIANIKTDSITSNLNNLKRFFLPLNTNNINNVYVDSVWFASDFLYKGQNVEITAKITNWGKDKIEKLPVKLFINGTQTSITSIDIEAKKSLNVTMNFTLQQTGLINGKISLLDNPITFDDDFFFSFNIKDKINLCVINGNKNNIYIERLFAQNNEINIVKMTENNINYNDLPKFSAIILNEIRQMTSGLTSELKRFCENGGTVVIIPNSNIELQSYKIAMRELKIATYEMQINKGNKVSIINIESSLYKGVFSAKVENMEMPKVNWYFSFENNRNVSKEKIMTMQTGDDFLCMCRINRGKIYVFATDLTENSTDFISQSLFVPTLWNMILFSSTILSPYYFLSDNPFIDLTSFLDASHKIIKIKDNTSTSKKQKQEYIAQTLNLSNHSGIMLHNQIKTAGNYSIVADTAFAGISFNYDRKESRLEFLSANEIRTLLKQQQITNIEVFNASKEISSYFRKSESLFNFTPLLIGLILLCIVLEIFILRKNIFLQSVN